MSRPHRWIATALLLAGLGTATGCSQAASEADIGGDPASVTALDEAGQLHQIELGTDAAARIGLETDTVRSLSGAAGKGARSAVSIAAVLYDQNGATWVYVETKALTFRRVPVTVTGVRGDLALLSAGPAVGTAVVTQGAAELRGSEDGVPGE
jgi:hypothetical protein